LKEQEIRAGALRRAHGREEEKEAQTANEKETPAKEAIFGH
jgi:hypothetical protein